MYLMTWLYSGKHLDLVTQSILSLLQAGRIEAHEELALALSRGLELDTQRSSRDSIQCSSGYSTQTNTPCCSEDTIPSQGSTLLCNPPSLLSPLSSNIQHLIVIKLC